MAGYASHFCSNRRQSMPIPIGYACEFCGESAEDPGVAPFQTSSMTNGEGYYPSISTSPFIGGVVSTLEPRYHSSPPMSSGWPITSAPSANAMYLPSMLDSGHHNSYPQSHFDPSFGIPPPPHHVNSTVTVPSMLVPSTKAQETTTTAAEYSGELRVACPIAKCNNKTFANNADFERHMQVAHKEEHTNKFAPRPRVVCPYEACANTTFSRPADVERHIQTVHKKESISLMDCPWPRCHRRGNRGFARKDHWLEHRRCYHREDLPKGRKGPNSGTKSSDAAD